MVAPWSQLPMVTPFQRWALETTGLSGSLSLVPASVPASDTHEKNKTETVVFQNISYILQVPLQFRFWDTRGELMIWSIRMFCWHVFLRGCFRHAIFWGRFSRSCEGWSFAKPNGLPRNTGDRTSFDSSLYVLPHHAPANWHNWHGNLLFVFCRWLWLFSASPCLLSWPMSQKQVAQTPVRRVLLRTRVSLPRRWAAARGQVWIARCGLCLICIKHHLPSGTD